jgi:adenylylsulfate kinase
MIGAGGVIVWFTGMPSAGKSTLAREVGSVVRSVRAVEILDGDEVRAQLSVGLGFSREDRDTNVRRIGFVARLLARHGVLVITAAISPYAATREEMRRLAELDNIRFVEVFVRADLDVLVRRDVKGLYKRALAGELLHFTGVSDPYEAPTSPDLVVRTDLETVGESVEKIVRVLVTHGILPDTSTAPHGQR